MTGPLPSDLESRAFSVADALRRGVTPARLRRTDLRADFHGVRSPRTAAQDVESLCRAFATRMRADQYFSHDTAAVLWGLRLPWRIQASRILHVTTVLPGRTPRTRGVVGHHADAPGAELAMHRGFLLPRPAEVWRMLATRLDVGELVVAGDGLICRRDPLATLAQLRRAVARNAGRRGNRALRAAFGLLRPGTDSARETDLRLAIVVAGLPEPEVDVRVSAAGARERRGDLVFVRWRVLVEYEGIHHQSSREAYLSDIDRFEELAGEWRIVRVTKEHAIPEVIARITRALLANGWRP